MLSSGSHTIKVVKKSGSYMVIDALKIYTAAVTTTQVNNTASGITYTGGWGYDTNRGLGDYNDDLHYTQTNNDSVSYTFTGIGLTYVAEKNFDEGDVDIYIDNVFQATVSCYSASRMVQQGVWTTSNLTSGQHTFKAVKKTGSYMILDALKIYSQ